RGKVVLSNGKPIPPDMRVTLSADRAWDSQIATLSPDGRFEFHGLPAGVYGLAPAVKGYRLPEGVGVEALVNRDVNDVVIQMEPAPKRP
ncbi:MAG: carboxypeptidase-like regulatory domain-containing protein, partial [Bryobacteraceae bacterium]